MHGDVRVDDYFWLRERENPEVLAYLEAENAFTKTVMAGTEELQTELFEELKNRLEPDKTSVPALFNGYFYYERYEEGGEYPLHCRRQGSVEAPEQVMLDVNRIAEGYNFCSVRGVAPSQDSRLLAWAVDTVGRRKYSIKFTNLETGEALEDVIPDVTGNLVWANDNRTLFYTRQDPETLRSYQVYRHVLGTVPSEDVLIYEETDPTFSVGTWKTRSSKYILIQSRQTLATEIHFIDADEPEGRLKTIAPRERAVEYSAAHVGDSFIIRTNLDAENFRLVKAPVAEPGRANWKELIPGREDVFLQGVDVFQNFMVVTERREGLSHLRIVPWDSGEDFEIEFDEPAYVTWVDENHEMETAVLRYGYSSLNTPQTIYDLDLETHERTLLKQEKILGGFASENYTVERLMAPARDGVQVPVSLVYRKGTPRNGTSPLLLYAYGSYGSISEAWFRPEVVSLLDRGFVYAIAHIRGGQEMGRRWYEDGKLLNKKNTFTDFIDCGAAPGRRGLHRARSAVRQGRQRRRTADGCRAQHGARAFRGHHRQCSVRRRSHHHARRHDPADDRRVRRVGQSRTTPSTTTTCCRIRPTTTSQPRPIQRSWSPPASHDSQVQYFEPAKWVAKLRSMKTDDRPLLFKCEMAAAGHGGVSGRFKRYHETALEYAFMLEVLAGRL